MATPRLTLREITERLGGEVVGEADAPLSGIASLDDAGPGQLTFLASPKFRSRLAGTRAAAVIVGPKDRDATTLPRIVAANPYAYYARAVALFHPAKPVVAGIHPSAVVDSSARVAPSACVGPFAVIEAGAAVGERATIGAGCYVGEGAVIGDDTFLHPRVTVYHACVVGARGILHSGAVIGADGFGMAPENGAWVKIPQVGRAVLGDDVEVGANTTIDRGALGDTVVEEGVKLDNQIQIAHNCRVGAHTVIAGCAGIAGSTTIGRHCLIGGGVGIIGHLTICDGVTVSGMTLVTKSITAPGTYTSGGPFMPHAEWLRNAAHLRHLDRIAHDARAASRQGKADGTDDD
ncbi:MAG: UDP-3-O-(3-hydroxymyristoyl)glucosamine N-acyltransferase [Betaproteobacteria bacterium]|nr:UDP-3-O-(3-hydroxymyristoyl)glucosamine N-acyltransferase [Betaproteobacteria bacterium]